MAKQPNQKLKLLYLKDYLLRFSDEDHPVTISDMQAYLSAQGVSAERKSLYDDLSALENYGLDIVQTTKGRAGAWYVASRDFQLPEVKLLVDAVQSSRFITQAKTASLIKKIENLASSWEGSSLQRQVVVQNRVKAMNESVFYNVDTISEAIGQGRAISFKYFDYGPDKQRHDRHNGQTYVVSPEFMVWDDENYYLVACPSGSDSPRHYRVDKMRDIKAEEAEAVKSGADPAEYTSALFGMYGGRRQRVRLAFDKSMASVAIDRFGRDMLFVPLNEGRFAINADIAVSPQFFAWMAALGDKAEILAPREVREQMASFLSESLRLYNKE